MATVITFGIQNGGCAKSISAAVTAWILSENHKVLGVDMDSQGNFTEVFLQVPMRKLRSGPCSFDLSIIVYVIGCCCLPYETGKNTKR